MVVATRRQTRGRPPLPNTDHNDVTAAKSVRTNEHRQTRSRRTSSKAASVAPNGPDKAPERSGSTAAMAAACGDTTTNNNDPSHFLDGIQLDRCTDALSIPDPPSPTARRLSMPLTLSSHPLREISNASDTEEDNPHITTRRRKTNKKRKTLMGVPSSSTTVQPTATAAASAPAQNAQPTTHPKKQDETIPQQPQHTVPSTKRSKKRQSFVLPSDTDSSKDDGYTKTYMAFKHHPASLAHETKTLTQPGSQSTATPTHVQNAQPTTHPKTENGAQQPQQPHHNEPITKRRKKRQSFVPPSDLESTDSSKDDGYTKTYAAYKHHPASPAHETKTLTQPGSQSTATSTHVQNAQPTTHPKTQDRAQQPQPHHKEPSTKRRKKRQSLVLPTDLESTDYSKDASHASQDEGYIQTYASFKHHPSSPARETKTLTQPSSLADLRQLVHAYTAVPKAERTPNLASVQELAERTGYKLRSCPPTLDNVPLPHFSQDQKHTIVRSLGPELAQMDACKVSDAQMVRDVTLCVPERLRGGYFRYYHRDTGRAVNPHEYQQRYTVMWDEVHTIRSQAWKEYFEQLRDEDNEEDEEEKEEEDHEATEDHETTEDDAKRTANSFQKALLTPQPKCADSDDETDTTTTVSTEGDEVLLPFPDRDDESSNPRIAQAERKLWRTIDQALAEYSAEVMAAQQEAATRVSH